MTELMRKFTKQDIRNTLAVFIVILFFISLWKLMKTSIPDVNKDVVFVVIGSLASSFAGIVGYYFGQSKSENDVRKKALETNED